MAFARGEATGFIQLLSEGLGVEFNPGDFEYSQQSFSGMGSTLYDDPDLATNFQAGHNFGYGLGFYGSLAAAGAGGGEEAAAARLPQDINVNPQAPAALPTNRPIGLSATQNAEAQRIVANLRAQGYTDIRVNQQQLDAQGVRVGVNRPDIQATSPGGQRVHYELDRASSTRGAAHDARIMANDPQAKVTLKTVN